MKALVISHRAVLQKCPLTAIFRQSSVQNHLQQKEKKNILFSLLWLVENWLTIFGLILKFQVTQWHAYSLLNHKKQGPRQEPTNRDL